VSVSERTPPGNELELSAHAPGSSKVSEFYRKELLRLVGNDSAIVGRLVDAIESYIQKRIERMSSEFQETGEARSVAPKGGANDVARPPTRKDILMRLENIEMLATKLAEQLDLPNPFFSRIQNALPPNEKDLIGPDAQHKLKYLSDAAHAVRQWAETNYEQSDKDTSDPWLADRVETILSSEGVPPDRYLRVLRRCFAAVGEAGSRADQFANRQWSD